MRRASFLGLPRELRDLIYSHIVTKADNCKPYNPVHTYLDIPSCSCYAQAMIQASRQIQIEFLALFYQKHEVRLPLDENLKSYLQKWLDSAAAETFRYIARFEFKKTKTNAPWDVEEMRIRFETEQDGQGMRIEMTKTVGSVRPGDEGEVELDEEDVGRLVELRRVGSELSRAQGRPTLTKEVLLELLGIVGWKPVVDLAKM